MTILHNTFLWASLLYYSFHFHLLLLGFLQHLSTMQRHSRIATQSTFCHCKHTITTLFKPLQLSLSKCNAVHPLEGRFIPCSRIPRICEFSLFHYSICLTNTIIMYMMVSLPHRRSTELVRRPPLITAFWRVKKRDYHFWCRSYSMNTIDIELAHAMLDLHHWFSNCCLYGIFSIPVSIHRCWNR